jgi:hypothetical protein
MARSIETILKEQLGNLLMQLAIVQSQLEEALDKNMANKEIEKSKPEKEAK